ncbi:S-layer homology domain-containing protein [Ammoniphilus resinae]|uniref:Spore germination protein YaaH n=1 Tax=Ammoniphilus resinae TaxID=861532 RepID=A0ABS4GTL7_9BACL|nr:S-layer homology domain-containing protein [Ammoniphilus resinae]MBP1933618.1 spore germination protein YaaH [Ammoniphilus resinae]
MKRCLSLVMILTLLLTIGSASAQAPEHNNIIYLFGANSSTYKKQLEKTNGLVGTLAPNYFNLSQDGKLLTSVDRDFVKYAHQKGYRITPFISNHWDQQLGIKAMKNKDQLAEQIANAVLQYDLDGVDLDIENLTAAERNLQTDFVKQLTQKLHPHGKTVTIAVAPAQSNTTRGWIGSYDYESIGKLVDHVYIMAYDQSYPGGPVGPVASVNWVEKSLKYMVTKIDSKKLVLGLPLYGRYWTEQIKGDGLFYSNTMKLLEKSNGKAVYDAKTGSMTASFKGSNNQNYTVWFDNAKTLMEKIRLVDQYDLRGWGAWHLGQEDPALWTALSGETPLFRDISQHWANEEIVDIADQGIIKGYQDATFRPNQSISREEVTALLLRLMKFQPKDEIYFQDINTSRWSAEAIQTMASYGMVTGYPDQTFQPKRPITRAELAVILDRCFKFSDSSIKGSVSMWDVDSHWAKKEIIELQKAGVVTGYKDGSYRPNAFVSRAEVAVMIDRIID